MVSEDAMRKMLMPFLRLSRQMLDVGLANSRVLPAKIREGPLTSPYIAGKLFPYEAARSSYLVPKESPERNATGCSLPIPPPKLWWRYANTEEQYLQWGETVVDRMKAILHATGFSLGEGSTVLDFGCASGIMIRWLRDVAETGAVWGVDISAEHMWWCEQHLSPPFKFATTTTFPHLPFEDRAFDLIYAGSVFTHIADLAESWLLELKRILRPGGKLYLTVLDKHSIDLLLDPEYSQRMGQARMTQLLRQMEEQLHFKTADFAVLTIDRTEAIVYYDIDFLRRHWGNYLRVLSVTPEAYGYQTAIVLEK
jgi:ubiquinone/menaquinone biosynthesis C-methylase UbiE